MSIKTVIFDWAGTTVDFGSFAPVDAFISAFGAFGVAPTTDETRAPMGLAKRAHIVAMLAGERLAAQWIQVHGKAHTETDIDAIYAKFEPELFTVLEKYAEPLPGILKTVARLREAGLKIGSTTGYTRAMMEIVAPLAKSKGYAPDCLFCPDETGGHGRPMPYMLWKNLETLGAKSIAEVIKIGDTEADILEAKAAGCRSAGIIAGSSMLGLNEKELAALDNSARAKHFAEARRKYYLLGADFVLDSIAELPELILGGQHCE